MFRRDDFDYALPDELIAQHPPAERGGSRLLVVAEDGLQHLDFAELPGLLGAGDLLVVNDTRVIKGRLLAEKDSGGKAEILLERIESERVALCQVRVSKPLKAGRTLAVGGLTLTVRGREGPFYRLEFPESVLAILERHGKLPLPPLLRIRYPRTNVNIARLIVASTRYVGLGALG